MGPKIIAAAAAALSLVAVPAITHSADAGPHVAAVADAAAKRQILALEAARNQAILKGDAKALADMTSDDYTFVTIRGELRTKPEIVHGFATGAFKYDSREISDLNVRIYGNTAIVTGRASQKGVENSKDYSGAYRFTRVYVRQGGKWKTVALQTTLEAGG